MVADCPTLPSLGAVMTVVVLAVPTVKERVFEMEFPEPEKAATLKTSDVILVVKLTGKL